MRRNQSGDQRPMTPRLRDGNSVSRTTYGREEQRVNLAQAFQLIPALQVIFSTEIEYVEESFRELSAEQYEIYRSKHGKETEKIYEIVAIERTAIERTPEKVTYELNIVMGSERKRLLEAVKFIYHCTKPPGLPAKASFDDRLEYLRKRFPKEMLSMPQSNS